MNKSEMLNSLYKKFKLTEEDVFDHKHYKIITRSGIDKIQSSAKIHIEYELLYNSVDCKYIIILAKGTQGGNTISSFGEANPLNNRNAYPIAIAEKRAMSRVVLKLTGFYELGVFAEDEAEDFKKENNKTDKKS